MTTVQEVGDDLALKERQVRIPEGLTKVRFPAGSMICREGEIGDQLFIVNSGLVAIKKRHKARDVVLGYLGRGELFGELAMLHGKTRMASAWAVRDTECLVMNEDDFRQRIASADPFIQDVLSVLTRGIKSLAEDWVGHRANSGGTGGLK